MKDWIKEHNLTLKIQKGYTGILVGQVKEFPVIVQGKTNEEIINKLNKGLEGYFIAFPEELTKLKK